MRQKRVNCRGYFYALNTFIRFRAAFTTFEGQAKDCAIASCRDPIYAKQIVEQLNATVGCDTPSEEDLIKLGIVSPE